MNSPNLTTVPLPPANGRSIGEIRAAQPLGACPGRPGHRVKTGENSRPTNGEDSPAAHTSQLQGPELTYLKRTLDAEIKRPTCHLNMVRPGKGRWLASTCTPDENLHQNLFEAGTVESRLRLPKCSFAPRRAFS